jgi:1-acyl-sn-glycerol-3-phosphate acyltransferase
MDDRPATAAEIIRSLVFYLVFYTGSLIVVLAAIIAAQVAPKLFDRAAWGWSGYHRWCAHRILGIRVSVGGFSPRDGVLYAIKHESFFEAIDLPYQYPRPVVFAKAELLRIPLWGPVGRRFGLIGVDREAGARSLRTMLSEARRRIADGRPLVIFPEGTRVPHGRPAPLQSGFAGLYKLLGLPVIPVAVDSGALYNRRWKRSGTVHYRAGAEIPPGLDRAEIEARVLAEINALSGTSSSPSNSIGT